jgi:hypothetical protein
MMSNQGKTPGTLGKKIATVGAAMIAVSILLALLGIGGTLHDVLQYGGLGAGVVGIVLWRIVKV